MGHQYEVIGRHVPTEREPQPKAYRIKLFTKNETQARSRFWYFIRRLVKMKKANAEILSVREIFEKKPEKVSKYGLWIRYDSRSGTPTCTRSTPHSARTRLCKRCTRRWRAVTVLVSPRSTSSRLLRSRPPSASVPTRSSSSRPTLPSLCPTVLPALPPRASTRASSSSCPSLTSSKLLACLRTIKTLASPK